MSKTPKHEGVFLRTSVSVAFALIRGGQALMERSALRRFTRVLLSLLLFWGKLAAGGCTSTCGALCFECEVKAETLSCLAMPGGQ